jgi:hypothetical protein
LIHYLVALTLVFVIFILVSFSFYGWGKIVVHLFGIKRNNIHPDITILWIGWCIALSVFQISHLFFPLNIYVVLPIYVLGIVFAYDKLIQIVRPLFQKSVPDYKLLIISLIPFSFIIWLVSRSMLSPTNYDGGLYYFNTIRWINTYPIIPGIGNLHSRLAYNQSLFMFVASLNFSPFFNNGRVIANSFLFLLSFATAVSYLWPIKQNPSKVFDSHPFIYQPSLFALPILFYLIMSQGFALSPDITSGLLQLALFLILTRSISQWIEFRSIDNYSVLLISILSATSITIKLSNLIYVCVIIFFILIFLWKSRKNSYKATLFIFIPSLIIIIVWSLRGILLSGVPFYPSTIGYLPVNWAVNKASIVNEANLIYSWARKPHESWNIVLGNWNWLESWILRNFNNLIEYLIPITFFSFALVISSITRYIKKGEKFHPFEIAILYPSLLSIIFWFFTAPDFRFADCLIYLFLISILLLFFISSRGIVNRKLFTFLFLVIFILGNFRSLHNALINQNIYRDISLIGFEKVTEVPLIKKETKSGLEVYVPVSGDQCWDSPLPCTPYFNDSLSLRIPGNIRSGFLTINSKN